jgi:glycosyltransferase involved in cell wall biosynthesis
MLAMVPFQSQAFSLSIVVPVFNEVENLETLTTKIKETMDVLHPTFWEAIFVDDGSNDGSAELLDRLRKRNPRIRPIHFIHNQGQTAAFDAGFRAARGDYVITMDADLQNDPGDISQLLAKMEPGIGAVCGVRTQRKDSFIRRVSSKLANAVRNKLSGETITDTGCSLKVFRRECLEKITLFEGMHRFFPTLVKMEGYRVSEVPVSHHPRLAGESKYGVWNRVFKSFGDLLAVRWMKRRKLRYEIAEGLDDPRLMHRLERGTLTEPPPVPET